MNTLSEDLGIVIKEILRCPSDLRVAARSPLRKSHWLFLRALRTSGWPPEMNSLANIQECNQRWICLRISSTCIRWQQILFLYINVPCRSVCRQGGYRVSIAMNEYVSWILLADCVFILEQQTGVLRFDVWSDFFWVRFGQLRMYGDLCTKSKIWYDYWFRMAVSSVRLSRIMPAFSFVMSLGGSISGTMIGNIFAADAARMPL